MRKLATLACSSMAIACLLTQSGEAQVRSWDEDNGGLWSDQFNWSGNDRPDSTTESASLDGNDVYTVTLDQFFQIDDLTISNQNATLNINPNTSNATLGVNGDVVNDGAIRLNSDSTLDSTLSVNGQLTNNGTVSFGGTADTPATLRRLLANVVNNGTFQVDQDADVSKTSGVFSNHGQVNIANGKTFQSTTAATTFNQEAGNIDNQGTIKFSSDTLNFNGGSFSGNNVEINNSNLNIGGNAGSGTFDIFGASGFSGDVAANQTLNIGTNTSSATVTANSDIVNEGVINMDSDNTLDVTLSRNGNITNNNVINFGGTADTAATLRRVLANELVNNGVLNVNQNAELSRSTGILTNNGQVNIAAGKSFESRNVVSTVNQNAGNIDIQGSFNFSSDTLNFNGGNFTGNSIDILNSTLNIANGNNGTGEFNMLGNSSFSGDLEATQQLNILTATSSGTVTATSDLTNRGVINMDSDSTLDVTLVRNGTITNDNVINFGGTADTAATLRRIHATNFVNNGTLNVNQNAELSQSTGTFTNNGQVNIAADKTFQSRNIVSTVNQDGGNIDVQGSFDMSNDTLNFNGGNFTGNDITMRSGTLNIGAGSTGSGTFNLTSTSTISGDLAAAQTVNIIESGSNSTLTAVGDFTNEGTLNLISDSTADVALNLNGTLTNEGSISFDGTSDSISTFRRLLAEVDNRGNIAVIAEGANTEIGRFGADHVNSGQIISRQAGSTVEFLGSSFVNESDGIISGLGEFDFTQTDLFNDGTLDAGLSAGVMTLDGDVLMGANSQLLVELGGTIQGTEHDFYDVLDEIGLDGKLDIELIDGFENSILSTDVFTVLSAANLNGTFAGLNDGDLIADSNGFGFFTINYVGNDVQLSNFQFSAVPEPSGVVLLLLAFGAFGLRRRRSNVCV